MEPFPLYSCLALAFRIFQHSFFIRKTFYFAPPQPRYQLGSSPDKHLLDTLQLHSPSSVKGIIEREAISCAFLISSTVLLRLSSRCDAGIITLKFVEEDELVEEEEEEEKEKEENNKERGKIRESRMRWTSWVVLVSVPFIPSQCWEKSVRQKVGC